MKKKGLKVLVGSAAVAVLAMGGGIAGTFALFNRTITNTVHIVVGNLGFTFQRTKLVSHALSDEGLLVDTTDTTVLDLSTNGSMAIEVTNAAPGANYTGTFKIHNGGKVAFKATYEIVDYVITFNGADASADQKAEFLNHSSISFDGGAAQRLNVEGGISYVMDDVIKVNDDKVFTMKIDLETAMGNLAQDLDVVVNTRLKLVQYAG